MANLFIIDFRQDINSKGEAEDWITYGPADDIKNTQTECPVRWLIPPAEYANDPTGIKQLHMTTIWNEIQPAYDAWKAGEEMPEYGTPIGAWAAVNKAQVSVFKQHNVKSIEEIRDMSESLISKIRIPQVRDIMKQAAEYLEGKDAATMAKEKVEAEARIAGLEEKLEAAMELLEKHTKPPAKKTKEAA